MGNVIKGNFPENNLIKAEAMKNASETYKKAVEHEKFVLDFCHETVDLFTEGVDFSIGRCRYEFTFGNKAVTVIPDYIGIFKGKTGIHLFKNEMSEELLHREILKAIQYDYKIVYVHGNKE